MSIKSYRLLAPPRFELQRISEADWEITYNGSFVGTISYLWTETGIHIYNIFVEPAYRPWFRFGHWIKSFGQPIYAHDVKPCMVQYWHNLGAEVVNELPRPAFEDIVFEEREFEDFA